MVEGSLFFSDFFPPYFPDAGFQTTHGYKIKTLLKKKRERKEKSNVGEKQMHCKD